MWWFLSIAGHAAGLNDRQLADIRRAMPATHKLLQVVRQAEPLLTEAMREWDEVAPAADDIIELLTRGKK